MKLKFNMFLGSALFSGILFALFLITIKYDTTDWHGHMSVFEFLAGGAGTSCFMFIIFYFIECSD